MATTHRTQLVRALTALQNDHFFVLAGSIDDQDHGHEIAAEKADELGRDDFSYVFIHRQTLERSFYPDGSLRSPVMLHWGGDHAAIAEQLSALSEPWEAYDLGEDHAFAITLPGVDGEGVEDVALPPIDADKVAIATAAAQLADSEAVDDEASTWLLGVLGQEDPKIHAAVLDLATQHLDNPQIRDAVLTTFPDSYRAYGDSAPVAALLAALHERNDERFETVLAQAEKQRAWSFRYDVAQTLEKYRPAGALARLRKLATARDDRYGHASNPVAVDGYIAVLAAERGCSQVDAAEEVALDESFPPGARERAVEQLVYAAEAEPSPLRAPRGALAYLRAGRGTPELRRAVFDQGADFRTFLRAQAEPSEELPLIEGLVDVAPTIDGASSEAVQWLTERREELKSS